MNGISFEALSISVSGNSLKGTRQEDHISWELQGFLKPHLPPLLVAPRSILTTFFSMRSSTHLPETISLSLDPRF